MIDTAKLRMLAEVAQGYQLRLEAEKLSALLDELDALRDCGQEGVCRVPPGCARHWEERNRELVAERDQLRKEKEAASCAFAEVDAQRWLLDGQVTGAVQALTAWRTATGCDTPAEAQTAVELVAACVEGAEVERDQYRAAIHAQKDELARLRVLEARALEWLTAPTLAAGYHERPCACRFHALEAAIVACRAAKEGA